MMVNGKVTNKDKMKRKTSVIVKLQIEGIHAWKGVPDELIPHVGFLKFPHRHMFHIKVVKAVTHDDRDVEIIDLKRKIIHYLSDRYGTSAVPEVKMWHDFADMSCEMIAAELCQAFDLASCEVLEDNENGAVVDVELSYDDQPNLPLDIGHRDIEEYPGTVPLKPNITFVCGPLRSGKSLYAKAIANHFNDNLNKFVVSIEVSDIVKRVIGSDRRDMLQRRPDLDQQIIKEIRMSVLENPQSEHVVSGARQMSILEAFPRANCIWIDAPNDERFKRFQFSNKDNDKSWVGFREANKLDNELGLEEVKKFIFTRNTL
jgi:hypothetical protein